MYDKWNREMDCLEQGNSSYVWDELEELITDDFEEERLTADEFDRLMKRLMAIA